MTKSESYIVTVDNNGDFQNLVDPGLLGNYALKADVDPATGSKQVPDDPWQIGIQVVEPKYNPSELVDLLDFNSYHADCVDAVAGDAAGISYTLFPVEGEKENQDHYNLFMNFL
ncbi:MAG: hypothetical protein IJ672_04775, partial [Methanobrevibacter sp.]|nr:hypothetical protein [Methanobrevibacter sp.]